MRFLLGTLLFVLPLFAQPGPVEVMILGSYHFGNPGRDIANVKVDDVLQPARQRQIEAVVAGLSKFRPTKVAVEAKAGTPPTLASYREYRAGAGRDKRNEIQQIGFRLAAALGHQEVYGIDVDGSFPFEAVQAWAKAHGQEPRLEKLIALVQARVKDLEDRQATSTVGQVLRSMNEPSLIRTDNDFYMELLRFGGGSEQPGAAVVAGWNERNISICARLVQLAEPGDRIFVLYGAGHSYLLRQCIAGMPGFRLVEPNGYLPR